MYGNPFLSPPTLVSPSHFVTHKQNALPFVPGLLQAPVTLSDDDFGRSVLTAPGQLLRWSTTVADDTPSYQYSNTQYYQQQQQPQYLDRGVPELIQDSSDSSPGGASLVFSPPLDSFNPSSTSSTSSLLFDQQQQPTWLPQYITMSDDGSNRNERASSVPVQTLPKPIRRRTQEWKDQQSFVPQYFGQQQLATNGAAVAGGAGGGAPSTFPPPMLQSNGMQQQQQFTPQQLQQQYILMQQQQQQQQLLLQQSLAASPHFQPPPQQIPFTSTSSPAFQLAPSGMYAPTTDHPLSLHEQQDLLDRVRRDLNGVDLDQIKGPLRALALDPSSSIGATATAGEGDSGSLYSSHRSFNDPAYGSQQAVELERQELLRKTVSPQEAFLDYDDVDHRLHPNQQSSPRTSNAFVGLGNTAPSLFAPLPTRDKLERGQQQVPRTPPPVSTTKLATIGSSTMADEKKHSSSSVNVVKARAGSPSMTTSPRSSARKPSHPFAVPDNAVSWVDRTGTEDKNKTTTTTKTTTNNGVEHTSNNVLKPTTSSSEDGDDDDYEVGGIASGVEDSSIRSTTTGGKTKADGTVVHPPVPSTTTLTDKGVDDVQHEPEPTLSDQDGPLADVVAELEQKTVKNNNNATTSTTTMTSDPLLADRYEVPPPPKTADMTPAFGFAPPPPAGAAATVENHNVKANEDEDDQSDIDGPNDMYASARPRREGNSETTGDYYYFDNRESSDENGVPRPHGAAQRRPGGSSVNQRKRSYGGAASSDGDASFQDDDDDDGWGSDYGFNTSHSNSKRKSNSNKDGSNQPHKRRRRAPKQQRDGDSIVTLQNGGVACPHINKDGLPCGTIFRRPYDLARHRETIHGEGKPGKKVDWNCQECGGTFSRKDALIRHARIRNHTSGL
ncbi:hypothetical protein OIO90_004127 [Microbotryomycetes sp. JL221]|nr:hypothetical protein OIO90_004127 [Microbotryomycetes sp. JL221]